MQAKYFSLSVVNVDTTVQEKAVAFPTDARLYHKSRGVLLRLAKKMGIDLRQSFERLSKLAQAKRGRYAHARQAQRAKREQKRLKTYHGRVIRDVERKVALAQTTLPETQQHQLHGLLATAKQIHG